MENTINQGSSKPKTVTESNSFEITRPDSNETMIPLLIDSPHSGRVFPESFETSASHCALLSGWDAWIEDLYGDCTYFGATLVHQNISRMIIDLNRKYDDVSPDLIEGVENENELDFNPSEYSGRGMGLIRRYALPGIPISDSKVSMEEFKRRLEQYYFPYHDTIKSQLKSYKERFGMAWHINCHSMKSIGNAMNIDAGQKRADIVISDRDGSTGDPGLMDLIGKGFRESGYQVAVNNPYKGGYLVQAYSDPRRRIYSMQIELNRGLYMDEQHFNKKSEYDSLKSDINTVLHHASLYIKHFSNIE